MKEGWRKYKIHVLRLQDKGYPQVLRDISHAPKRIYYRGDIERIDFSKTLGIVGSRRMSTYGERVARKFAVAASRAGVSLASGFMYGIDTVAHEACVEAQGVGLAVFASGLDYCYPFENNQLYTNILESGGVVVSEYEKDKKPRLWTFPQRNRIIAGLSGMGVLVVEGGSNSGSLLTARRAHMIGRSVFAVPGQIDSVVSAGANGLIKDGVAKMVVSPEDIFGHTEAEESLPQLTGTQGEIFKLLQIEGASLDEISMKIGIGVVEIGGEIGIMEMEGIVEEVQGRYYLSSRRAT